MPRGLTTGSQKTDKGLAAFPFEGDAADYNGQQHVL